MHLVLEKGVTQQTALQPRKERTEKIAWKMATAVWNLNHMTDTAAANWLCMFCKCAQSMLNEHVLKSDTEWL